MQGLPCLDGVTQLDGCRGTEHSQEHTGYLESIVTWGGVQRKPTYMSWGFPPVGRLGRCAVCYSSTLHQDQLDRTGMRESCKRTSVCEAEGAAVLGWAPRELCYTGTQSREAGIQTCLVGSCSTGKAGTGGSAQPTLSGVPLCREGYSAAVRVWLGYPRRHQRSLGPGGAVWEERSRHHLSTPARERAAAIAAL